MLTWKSRDKLLIRQPGDPATGRSTRDEANPLSRSRVMGQVPSSVEDSARCFVSLGRSSQKLSPPLQRGPAGSQESSDYSSPDGKMARVGCVKRKVPEAR